jgi:hypothetical protein
MISPFAKHGTVPVLDAQAFDEPDAPLERNRRRVVVDTTDDRGCTTTTSGGVQVVRCSRANPGMLGGALLVALGRCERESHG